jgi:hypothetical protein
VVAAQPRNYEAVIGLGVAQRGNRKFEEAEQQYLAAQKLDPSAARQLLQPRPALPGVQGERAGPSWSGPSASTATSSPGRQHRSPDAPDAEKRIKDIDELFVALAEAAKLQKEAEEIQRKAEEQQKKMEEEIKRCRSSGKKGRRGDHAAARDARPGRPPPRRPPTSSPTSPPPAGGGPDPQLTPAPRGSGRIVKNLGTHRSSVV